jgi:type VI secretion system protein ImpM
MSGAVGVGFYGKLPSHGDFLRRRVADAFLGVWDGWLQDCIEASRSMLGDTWLDVYLTSPAWRFACAAGACGPAPVVGVMAPSVDRVGRYFPLTVIAQLPLDAELVSVATTAHAFFDSVERLVIDTLSADVVDVDAFDVQLMMLGRVLEVTAPATVHLEPAAAAVLEGQHGAWQLPIGSASNLRAVLEQVMTHRLSMCVRAIGHVVDGWIGGSRAELPDNKGATAPRFLRRASRWVVGVGQMAVGQSGSRADAHAAELLVDDVTPPRFRSAAATDVGQVRQVNQDAFIERTDVGIWASPTVSVVTAKGEIASRMVCDALANIVPNSSFEDVVATARQRVGEVNEQLVRAAQPARQRRVEWKHGRGTVGTGHAVRRAVGRR